MRERMMSDVTTIEFIDAGRTYALTIVAYRSTAH